MATIFISHSSLDDPYATSLTEWLAYHGFEDFFVDHKSIPGGDSWRQALRDSVGSCRAIILLVTRHWLASDECFGEFLAGSYMGKRLIPLLLLSAMTELDDKERRRLDRVTAEDQGLMLTTCVGPDEKLNIDLDPNVAHLLQIGLQSAGANTRIGLDPQAFKINRQLRRTPFPGLASFGDEDADAALFYGRDREISEILEELRTMRASRRVRLLVIQGASGAGKSSLLKAGVIPRLRREAPAWLPMRAFRPGADPLLRQPA